MFEYKEVEILGKKINWPIIPADYQSPWDKFRSESVRKSLEMIEKANGKA